MLPTPDTSHVSFDNVYEPAEDSFLFLDTLSAPSEIDFLSTRLGAEATSNIRHGVAKHVSGCPLILEIGPGSGVILAFLAANASIIFGRPDVLTLGIDVHAFACQATAKSVIRNTTLEGHSTPPVFLDAVTGNLASCLRPSSVDVLIFNPPYVPSEELPPLPDAVSIHDKAQTKPKSDFDRDNHLLALATDGGAEGMETTLQLLDQLPAILSRRGVAYVLLCAQNRPETVKANIMKWNDTAGRGKWNVQTVGSSGKTGGWEKLQIVRIERLSM